MKALSANLARRTADEKRRRQIEHLHRLGPQALGEFLTEAVDLMDLEIELLRYGRLDPSDARYCGRRTDD